jgi:putative PIN family toxin of toxin-antitoxin system
MRVVIDTNCLIASIPKFGKHYWLYLAFKNKKFTWILSTEILNEYFEILSRFYSAETAEIVITVLLSSPNIELTEPYFNYNLIVADPDDNKFANLAISSNARYLVSNDKHFSIFKTIDFPPLDVIKLDLFKKILNIED